MQNNSVFDKTHYCVIGVDQSYTRTGIAGAFAEDCKSNKIYFVGSLNLLECKTKTDRRAELALALNEMREKIQSKWPGVPTAVVYERPRLFSGGHISANYLLSMGALNAVIIDFAVIHKLPCYSIDTRAWRAAVVGTAKKEENSEGIPPEKYFTVKYFCNLGYDSLIKFIDKKTGKELYNHDLADAMGIACAPFELALKGKLNLLKAEE